MAMLFGAAIGAGVLSRIFRVWLFKGAAGSRKIWAPNALTLMVVTILGGFGFADGGAPQFAYAFTLYVLPVLGWSIYDAVQARRSVAPS